MVTRLTMLRNEGEDRIVNSLYYDNQFIGSGVVAEFDESETRKEVGLAGYVSVYAMSGDKKQTIAGIPYQQGESRPMERVNELLEKNSQSMMEKAKKVLRRYNGRLMNSTNRLKQERDSKLLSLC